MRVDSEGLETEEAMVVEECGRSDAAAAASP